MKIINKIIVIILIFLILLLDLSCDDRDSAINFIDDDLIEYNNSLYKATTEYLYYANKKDSVLIEKYNKELFIGEISWFYNQNDEERNIIYHDYNNKYYIREGFALPSLSDIMIDEIYIVSDNHSEQSAYCDLVCDFELEDKIYLKNMFDFNTNNNINNNDYQYMYNIKIVNHNYKYLEVNMNKASICKMNTDFYLQIYYSHGVENFLLKEEYKIYFENAFDVINKMIILNL